MGKEIQIKSGVRDVVSGEEIDATKREVNRLYELSRTALTGVVNDVESLRHEVKIMGSEFAASERERGGDGSLRDVFERFAAATYEDSTARRCELAELRDIVMKLVNNIVRKDISP